MTARHVCAVQPCMMSGPVTCAYLLYYPGKCRPQKGASHRYFFRSSTTAKWRVRLCFLLLQLCPPGTQVDRQTGDRCLKCDPGFFNFDGTNCTACPVGERAWSGWRHNTQADKHVSSHLCWQQYEYCTSLMRVPSCLHISTFDVPRNPAITNVYLPGAQCAGGAALKVEPRFWRSNDTSPHVYQCQLARACEGELEGRCRPCSQCGRLV